MNVNIKEKYNIDIENEILKELLIKIYNVILIKYIV